MDFKSCKTTFNRIDDNKKHTILSTSIKAFSKHGFNSANINIIAEDSGVSVGAMYKYFDSKRALYLTCVEYVLFHLNEKIEEIVSQSNDMFMMFESFIKTIQIYRKEYEEFTKLYYEMATESNAEYAMVISSQIEGVTSNLYAGYIEKAKSNKEIRQDIDPRYFAFFIDNILMMLQFSYSCEYYIDRMKIYTYEDVLEDDDKLRSQVMLFIKGALLYNPNE